MTYDPIANTYVTDVPPCPFCGSPPRRPAIMPAGMQECSRCDFRVPAGQWERVCAALASDTADRVLRAERQRNTAFLRLRRVAGELDQVRQTLARDLAELEREL